MQHQIKPHLQFVCKGFAPIICQKLTYFNEVFVFWLFQCLCLSCFGFCYQYFHVEKWFFGFSASILSFILLFYQCQCLMMLFHLISDAEMYFPSISSTESVKRSIMADCVHMHGWFSLVMKLSAHLDCLHGGFCELNVWSAWRPPGRQASLTAPLSPACQFELPLPARASRAACLQSTCPAAHLWSDCIRIQILQRVLQMEQGFVPLMSQTLLTQRASLDYLTLVLLTFAFTALHFCSLTLATNPSPVCCFRSVRFAILRLFHIHMHFLWCIPWSIIHRMLIVLDLCTHCNIRNFWPIVHSKIIFLFGK